MDVESTDYRATALLDPSIRSSETTRMFVEYLNSILSVSEPVLEPAVDKIDDATRIRLREDQDLRCGAVRTALISEGSGKSPAIGDVIHFHYTVRQESSRQVVASTLAEHGGSGCQHVVVLEKGIRIPRGWELVLKDMKEGQVSLVYAKPEYSFEAPCDMARPSQLPEGVTSETELRLLHVVDGSNVKPLPINKAIIKTTLRSIEGWQTPRTPFNVTFRACMRPVTHFSTTDGDGSNLDSWQEHNSTMGCQALPEGIELALNSMPVSEKSSFVIPSTLLRLQSSTETWQAVPGAEGHETMQVFMELVAMEEVRDMTGDGKVLKRKCREGTGLFPVDAPVQDATVTIQYSLHEPSASKQAGNCIFTASSNIDSGKQLEATFSTGEGCMATAVEMAVRLMLPGEQSEVYFEETYGFKDASEAPEGVPVDKPMVAMLTLVSFEKEGHPQAMDAGQMIVYCGRKKDRGNALYAAGKFAFSLKRFDEALQALKTFRGDQTDTHTVEIRTVHIALLSNSAAALMGLKEYPEAIRRCDAAFEMDSTNNKLVLRRAKACSMNGDYQEAHEICNALLPLADDSMKPDIEELIELNRQRERAADKKQKAQFGRF